ncbi:MAG: phosphatidate cytidylyltransferase [Acidimicrobiia bacterium]
MDRHDDELAERRMSASRPQPDPGRPGMPPDAAGPLGAALPLEWEAVAGEPDEDDSESETAPTIDLTERASRDDLAAWSDVLRRRPPEAARITRHPSAAGEHLAARRRPDDDNDFARVLLERRRGRSGRSREGGEDREDDGAGEQPAAGVSRLRAVGPEPEGPGPSGGFGTELLTRIVTGVVVAGACLLTFNAGTGPTAWLVALIVGLGVLELCTALRADGQRPAVVIALVGSVALVLAAYESGQSAYPLVMALVVMGSLLWYLAQVVRGRPALGVATTLLPFAYVGGLGAFASLILGFDNGIGMLVGLAICTVAYDVCGYAAGRQFGRRPLTRVSPNKTIEGLVAGMVGSLVLSVAVVGMITPWDRFSALALGAVVAVLAPLGDLCESMLKRDLGVKDLGGLLPGHGGILDRFDAILFCLPAVYFLVRLLELN